MKLKFNLRSKILLLFTVLFAYSSAQVINNCLNCSASSCSSNSCSKCNSGWTSYSVSFRKFNCVKCGKPVCDECINSGLVDCSKCISGYRQEGIFERDPISGRSVLTRKVKCIKCTSGCAKCDTVKCIECESGYALKGTSCFVATGSTTSLNGTSSVSVVATKKK